MGKPTISTDVTIRQPDAPARFPRALAAYQKGQGALWELGDALVAECGPPPERSVNDGSRVALQACAEELLGLGGPEVTAHYLSKVRLVAYSFPPQSRVGLLAFAVHQAAGDSKNLQTIIDTTPEGKRITVLHVTDTRKAWEFAASEERRQVSDVARQELAKAEADMRQARAIQSATKDGEGLETITAQAEAATERHEAAMQKAIATAMPPKFKRGVPFSDDPCGPAFAWCSSGKVARMSVTVFSLPSCRTPSLTRVPGAIDPILRTSTRESFTAAPSSVVMTSPAMIPALAAGLSSLKAADFEAILRNHRA